MLPPVMALMATSETPKRMPAAVPMSTPWCSWWAPKRGEKTSSMPMPSRPASKTIIPGVE